MITLYNPQSSTARKPILPMSLLAVGAAIEGQHEYRIVDGNLVEDGYSALEETITESGSELLGMTVMPGPQLAEAVPLSRRLKKRFPNLKIVWGGYFPTLHAPVVLQSDCVDYVVRGHNELSFSGLANDLQRDNVPADLAGLGFRDPLTGNIRLNALGNVPDINTLPMFPYHRVDMQRYFRPTFMGQRTISHHSSYGCPFLCNFCAVVNMVGGRYSAETAERTAAVVGRLIDEYGADSVEFHDNNFFVKESRISEFCERIIDRKIGWWGYGRIDTLQKFSDHTWRLMRDSGLKMIFMGAEAGSDEVLSRMNKGGRQTADQALTIAERMRRFGIVPEMSFILGNPPEPAADVERTIRFIRRLKHVNPATEIIFYLYSPVPQAGSMLTEAEASGFAFPKSLDDWVSAKWQEFSHHRSADLPWLDAGLKRRIKNFQRVMHAAYPTTTDHRLTGLARSTLRAMGMWRYRLGLYAFPIELKVLERVFPYQRPEVSGF
jgi:hypothetical protein